MAGILDPEDFLGMLKQAAEEAEKSTHDLMGKIGLKSKIGVRTNSDKHAKELEAVYAKSLTRILKIVDKLSLGPIRQESIIREEVEEKFPDENMPPTFFNIGDRVKINCPFRDFKYIQKRVPAWKKNMANLHKQSGIVTDQHTKKDIVVQVYFPDIYSSCAIHTAVLELDDSPLKMARYTPWKVGDFVQTSSNKRVVKQLMLRLPDVPERYVGEPGKVIAVTTAGVFVTYDGLRSYCIDSALLRKADKDPEIKDEEKPHPRDFEPGEKVKVISNLKKLIENQKGNGGWNSKMCVMAGKYGYITDINGDGTIDVCTGFSRGWRMNAESIMRLKIDDEPECGDSELEFMPGDAVRLKITDEIRMHLVSKNIPLIFLEYLRITGEVDSIDDDLDAWTKFNSTGKICLQPSSLVKVSGKEKERYETIKKAASEIKCGSTVYLDVGPPNYVRAILSQHCKVTPDIAAALMKKSKVIGWTDAQHAVIQYDNENRYRINKKYLTVPDRFDVKIAENDDFNLGTVEELRKAIFSCVERIHRNDQTELLRENSSVDVYSMLKGRPPMVEFRIRSTVAERQLQKICEDLEQNHGWKLEKRGTIIDVASAGATCGQRFTAGFLFNDDVYISSITSGSSLSDTVNARKSEEKKKSGGLPEKTVKPEIQSVDEFEFITLQNKTLKRTVYFPYLVHGPSRIAEDPEGRKNNSQKSILVGSAQTINIGPRSGAMTIDSMIANSDVHY